MNEPRKFYRTVVNIEVLSEEPYQYTRLDVLTSDITAGDCSGTVYVSVDNEQKTGAEMAALLLDQGSDPEFFQLNYEGNDLQEQE